MQTKNYKRKLRNVTDTENTTIGAESDASESSIYRIERINRIVDRNKYLTTTLKINETEKVCKRDRITSINNAGRQQNAERNRNTESEALIPRCE